MFIHQLNTAQQNAFLYLAHEVINSDDYISSQEENIMREIMSQLPSTAVAERMDINDLPNLFSSKVIRKQLIFELIGIALVDSAYHENEASMISIISNALNIKPMELNAIIDLVKKLNATYLEISSYLHEET